jgi:exonuclease III
MSESPGEEQVNPQNRIRTHTRTETQTTTTNNIIDPLVFVPMLPPPLPIHNPYTRQTLPVPDPATLTPGQVIWNRLRNASAPLRRRFQQIIPIATTGETTPPTDGTESLPPTPLERAQAQWSTMMQPVPASTIPDGNQPIALSVENERSNDEWGDSMILPKPNNTTRIYGINVNGLTLDQRGGQFDVLCEVMKEVEADVVGGQEHNLDSDQTPVRSIIINTVRGHWNRSKATFGTTPIPFTNMYKPGGTFMVTAGNLSGRIIADAKDPWGRWVSHTYQGRGNLTITIFSAYQVVSKEITPGSTTTAAQQHSLLLQQNDTVINPRTAFRRDLTTAIQAAQALNQEVLLLGDFNEEFGSDPEGMTKVAVTCKLIDLMSSRHSTTPPATYARGRKRLDYALGTTHIAQALLRSGYEPFNIRFHSDHRAYYLDFDTLRLFGTDTQALGNNEPRILKSNNVKQNTEYIKLKYDLLVKHNAFERGERLSAPGNHHIQAERLDKDILAASLAAESRLKQYGSPAWSIKLASITSEEMCIHGAYRLESFATYDDCTPVGNRLRQ